VQSIRVTLLPSLLKGKPERSGRLGRPGTYRDFAPPGVPKYLHVVDLHLASLAIYTVYNAQPVPKAVGRCAAVGDPCAEPGTRLLS
jgi:hypothetical protein